MAFVLIGVVLLACKVLEFGAVANWSWWIILAPFALAVVWWSFADATGLTSKREMDKLEQKRVTRRARAMEALGLGPTKRKKR